MSGTPSPARCVNPEAVFLNRNFHFWRPDQDLYTLNSSPHRPDFFVHLLPAPDPVGSGSVDAGTDWSRSAKDTSATARVMLDRLLAKQPNDRYQSFQDVRRDLKQIGDSTSAV